jgi:hypothetical protein
MIQRMLCCVFGHKWTTVAAGFPKLQCMYCERVLTVAACRSPRLATRRPAQKKAAAYVNKIRDNNSQIASRACGVPLVTSHPIPWVGQGGGQNLIPIQKCQNTLITGGRHAPSL